MFPPGGLETQTVSLGSPQSLPQSRSSHVEAVLLPQQSSVSELHLFPAITLLGDEAEYQFSADFINHSK